ncbi:3-deoxy-D-manno-octulosonic acid transferase [Brevifollis gellanilyticus]|uniref:3-deoxy-D-manno-octulosonic acid transferase n=1 Tax=Brevifollis gellanilyticus TaxID=748831 RepID=A0A512MA83_9BACT|nr:glycosyltransferase N-terminal domain-containing protein [Brevifollis gellanilyticus]GEP43644.1 3-deoxy-D-manno-octulosonic acid transferase [Brevifollis gellanilyticus]
MSLLFTLIVYNLLLPLGILILLPGAVRKMKARGGRWEDMAGRFGRLPLEKKAAIAALPCGRDRIWMHAVSVGEAGIAMKLITRLLKEAPRTGVVLTTTTPTAHAMAEEFAVRQSGRVVVLYSPVDLPFVSEFFLDLIRPSQMILIEAEVWPNLVYSARRQGIQVSMVNARLSSKSERRFQQLGFLMCPVFGMLDQVHVQEPADVTRFATIGVPTANIHHTGSIKFDPQGAEADPAQVERLRAVMHQSGITAAHRPILFASTHNAEEALLAKVIQNLAAKHKDLALLIVPRHVERADSIVTELQSLGLDPVLRSQIHSSFVIRSSSLPTLLVDTTGELRAWQCLASIVIVGKSFLTTGGQNPAEAVMAKKPVLFGPHMENFEPLVDLLLKHQGALQVPDTTALESALDRLLSTPAQAQRLGESGHTALRAHEAATIKTLTLLGRHSQAGL